MGWKRRAAQATAALSAAAILVITLWSTPVDEPVHEQVESTISTLRHAGAPPQLDYAFVELSANVLLFIPLGLALALALPRSRWWLAAIAPLALSLGVELTQLLLLPERFASPHDVLANTAGGLTGAAVAALLRRRSRLARGAAGAD